MAQAVSQSGYEVDPDRVRRVRALARQVLGSAEQAEAWLSKPRRQFGGRSADDLMRSVDGGVEAVAQELQRIDHGFFA